MNLFITDWEPFSLDLLFLSWIFKYACKWHEIYKEILYIGFHI